MSFNITQEYSRPILRPLRLSKIAKTDASESTPGRWQPQSTSSAWRATTHVFAGTGNREIPKCWPPSRFGKDPSMIPDDNKYNISYDPATAATSQHGVYRMYEHVNLQATASSEPVPIPRIVVKRYIPTYNPKESTGVGLTLLILPGMGTPKEMFEPMIEHLLAQFQDMAVKVDEIWTLDMPLAGETALVNPIGYLYGNEKDISRDILLFITAYLPLIAGQDLPYELVPRQPTPNGQQPVRNNLHVIAHSLGAQCAILAATHAPKIFSSLTVLDPAIVPSGKIQKVFAKLGKEAFVFNAQYRYSDRESLVADLRSNQRTRGWSKQAMQKFVDWGVVPDGEGGLCLAGHPRLQWALYYDQETPSHCYDRLTDLRTPFNAIMPSRPFAVPPKQFEADVAKIQPKTRITWVANVTHQLPHEQTVECSKLIASWLKDESKARAHL